MDGGTWQITVIGSQGLDLSERLSLSLLIIRGFFLLLVIVFYNEYVLNLNLEKLELNINLLHITTKFIRFYFLMILCYS